MNRVDWIVLDPNRTYACTRTARTGVRVTQGSFGNSEEIPCKSPRFPTPQCYPVTCHQSPHKVVAAVGILFFKRLGFEVIATQTPKLLDIVLHIPGSTY